MVKAIAKSLADKKLKYQHRWKQLYLTTLLGLDMNMKVKYLTVSPGFGNTWVIIKYAMLLKSLGKKVCIVTTDTALRLQMQMSLTLAEDADILLKESDELKDLLGGGYVFLYDEYYDQLMRAKLLAMKNGKLTPSSHLATRTSYLL